MKDVRLFLSVITLLILLFSCQKEESKFDWIQTQNNCLFWGDITIDTLNYVWDGETIENLLHGVGSFQSYLDDILVNEVEISAYYGALNKEDIKKISSNEQYIGKIKNDFFDGFGILIKSTEDIYIGSFIESKPTGLLSWYKNNKLYYEGGWKNGLFEGFGSLYKADGIIKKGVWLEGELTQTDDTVETSQGTYTGGILNNLSDGFGAMTYKTGNYYEGMWQNGKWFGEGLFISANEDSIVGDWIDGKLEGYGFFKSNSFIYQGDWINNQPDGFGEIVYSDSTFYSGEWSHGKREGAGDIFYSNSDSYFGDWKEDQPDGIGRYYYSNGDRYCGEWESGYQNGFGIYESSEFRYEGSWNQGWINGIGKITYPNGDYYEGDFIENNKTGIGYYYFDNGNYYEGEFQDNKFEGLGVFQFAEGSRYEGTFTNGEIEGDGTLYYLDEVDSLAITAFWDGTGAFPKEASVLFSNGDLYEGELLNGFPTEKGFWTTAEERLEKEVKVQNSITRANDFYKKHHNVWNRMLIGTSVVLTTIQYAAVTNPPVAAVVYVINIGLNVVDASLAIASASIDVYTAKQSGEDVADAYNTLATEISVNTALIFIPKALRTPMATELKVTTRNVVKKSAIALNKSKPFAKCITIVQSSKGKLETVLSESSTKLFIKVGYKRYVKSPFDNKGNLKRYIRVKTGDNSRYISETDEFARLYRVQASKLQLTKREGRLPYNYNSPGKLKGDHAGHMIADRFGGSPELVNIISQSSNVNLSVYKKIENNLAKAIVQGKDVALDVIINYEGTAIRPSSFKVSYVIDNVKKTEIIYNL